MESYKMPNQNKRRLKKVVGGDKEQRQKVETSYKHDRY